MANQTTASCQVTSNARRRKIKTSRTRLVATRNGAAAKPQLALRLDALQQWLDQLRGPRDQTPPDMHTLQIKLGELSRTIDEVADLPSRVRHLGNRLEDLQQQIKIVKDRESAREDIDQNRPVVVTDKHPSMFRSVGPAPPGSAPEFTEADVPDAALQQAIDLFKLGQLAGPIERSLDRCHDVVERPVALPLGIRVEPLGQMKWAAIVDHPEAMSLGETLEDRSALVEGAFLVMTLSVDQEGLDDRDHSRTVGHGGRVGADLSLRRLPFAVTYQASRFFQYQGRADRAIGNPRERTTGSTTRTRKGLLPRPGCRRGGGILYPSSS